MRTVTFLLVLGILSFSFYAKVKTHQVEESLKDPETIFQELGYRIPTDAQIVKTEARIWSIADGENYHWTIRSVSSLKPWLDEIGARWEYKSTDSIDVYETFTEVNGKKEEASIELSCDEKTAVINTFRP